MLGNLKLLFFILSITLFFSRDSAAGNKYYAERKGNLYITSRPVFYLPSKINLDAPLANGLNIKTQTTASYEIRLMWRNNFNQRLSISFGFGYGNKKVKNRIDIDKSIFKEYYPVYDSEYNDYHDFPHEIESGASIPLYLEYRPLILKQHSLSLRLGGALYWTGIINYGSTISYDFQNSTTPEFIAYQEEIIVNPDNRIKFDAEIGTMYEFAFKKFGFLQIGAFFKFGLYNRYQYYQGNFQFLPNTTDETRGTITPSTLAFGLEANYIFSNPFRARAERSSSKRILKRRKRKDMEFHKSLY
ncbi:MAG: hypothetical protein WD048_08435 [Chitinophagales bacterium]